MQSQDTSSLQPRPPMKMVRRRIPIRAPEPLPFGAMVKDTRGPGVPLAVSPPEQQPLLCNDERAAKGTGKNRADRAPLNAGPGAENDANLDALPQTTPEVNAAAGIAMSTKRGTEPSLQSSFVERADPVETTVSCPLRQSSTGGESRSAARQNSSQLLEEASIGDKGHTHYSGVSAALSTTSATKTVEQDNPCDETVERPTAAANRIRSAPLFLMLTVVSLLCLWALYAVKDADVSGITFTGLVEISRKSGGGAAMGDSMTVHPEDDVAVAVRELRRKRVKYGSNGDRTQRAGIMDSRFLGRDVDHADDNSTAAAIPDAPF